MQTISIQIALDIIKNCNDSFELRFVRSTGQRKGSIKKARFFYGAPNPKPRTKSESTRNTPIENQVYKLSGTIPLTEVSNYRLSTPLISHIIGINDYQVVH